MRVAVVASNEQVVGGAETYVRWLLPALEKHGHDVAVAFEYRATEPSRRVDTRAGERTRWQLGELGADGLVTELDRYRPDIVYLQGLDDSQLEVTLLERFRTVLFAHAYWGTCLTGSRAHRWPARELCTRRFDLTCLSFNYARGCGPLNPKSLLRLYDAQRARRRALNTPAALIVASRYVRRTFELHGVDPDRIHVLPCPVTGTAPDPQPPKQRPPASKVLYLGRLTELKGVFEAVRATTLASSMLGRTLKLTIAGDGPALEACRELARKTPDTLEILGWVEGPRRSDLLRQADVLLVPGLWPEPFGMVGIEAACVGTPSVAYSAGGIPDWLSPGENGELAPSFDVSELAMALARVLSNPDHYNRLRQGAWTRAQNFDAERHLSALNRVFTASAT